MAANCIMPFPTNYGYKKMKSEKVEDAENAKKVESKFRFGKMYVCNSGGCEHEHRDIGEINRCQEVTEKRIDDLRRELEESQAARGEHENIKLQREKTMTEEQKVIQKNIELNIQIEKRKQWEINAAAQKANPEIHLLTERRKIEEIKAMAEKANPGVYIKIEHRKIEEALADIEKAKYEHQAQVEKRKIEEAKVNALPGMIKVEEAKAKAEDAKAKAEAAKAKAEEAKARAEEAKAKAEEAKAKAEEAKTMNTKLKLEIHRLTLKSKRTRQHIARALEYESSFDDGSYEHQIDTTGEVPSAISKLLFT